MRVPINEQPFVVIYFTLFNTIYYIFLQIQNVNNFGAENDLSFTENNLWVVNIKKTRLVKKA